jgi:membrane-bound lytic murein transglycosylase B
MKKLRKSGIVPVRCRIGSEKAYLISLRDGGKEELYLGSRNYRIITLYNHSARYAVTIALYAEALGY